VRSAGILPAAVLLLAACAAPGSVPEASHTGEGLVAHGPFRMRITGTNNGNAVVFDNRNGTATDMDVANPQAIAGGSIVIHKP